MQGSKYLDIIQFLKVCIMANTENHLKKTQ